MNSFTCRSIRAVLIGALSVIGALAFCGSAAAAPPAPPTGYQLQLFASGGTSRSKPDDITYLEGVIYVIYQNKTNADGSPPADGSPNISNVVGYLPNGTETGSWDVVGHADGVAADPSHHRLIVTVNEDADSSLYTIDPKARHDRQLRHYQYQYPNAVLPHGGGTDAISVVDGRILISASNPSPTQPNGSTYTGPAVYAARVPAHGSTAFITPTFYDNSSATDATTGKPAALNLSDPDSNAAVPGSSPRFGGDFMLDSQGDSELVFDRHPARPSQSLTVLHLSAPAGPPPQVDDVSWSTRPSGTLLVVDAATNNIYSITGPFGRGTALTSIPSSGSMLDGDIGTINLGSGLVSPFMAGFGSPKGLLYLPGNGVPGRSGGSGGNHDHSHHSGHRHGHARG